MASFNIDPESLYPSTLSSLIKDDLVNPEKIAENTSAEEPKEEWVWVVGYKGTFANMDALNDFQYELGKRYDMPEDAKIKACESGFHFCMELKDVFGYYKIEDGHRFFEVKALVRKSDVVKYGTEVRIHNGFFNTTSRVDKLAAKSIELVRELTIDEIFKDTEAADWSHEYKVMALSKGIEKIAKHTKRPDLIALGYSEAFVEWLVTQDNDRINIAFALGSQPGLSMDVKVMGIFMA